MLSIDTYSTTKDLVFDEGVNSYSCDELVFDVAYNGCFMIYPLMYGGELLQLKLSNVKMLTYFKMCNLLLDKIKDDIWKWFYCNPKCTVENGLTIVENDRDLKNIYEMANLHGLLDVDDCMGKRKESITPCYLRSPHLKPKNSFKEFKGNVLLDDFEDVEGEGEGLGSSSPNFVASHRSDEIRYDVYFEGCFFMCPLDYQDGQILYLRLPRSKRFSYKEMNDLLLDITKDEIWKLFYCKPKCTLEQGRKRGKVLLADFKSVGFRKGKVLLDDFEAVGNGKDKVDGDDVKDELISTKGDENKEWEYLLDIDDSDLQLLSPFRLSNSSNTSFFQSQEMDYVNEKSTRVILDPVGRIHKLRNFKDDPTQEYIRKLIDDVDEDFKRRPWVMALEIINDGGEIEGGCFGDIKSYIKNGKLKKVVAIITSCKPNVLGDMNVTLKDPSGTMSNTIHYEVLSSEDGYIKDMKVGSA
nr:hypothetical protein [Tanacetum cinerariifolium]